MTRSHDYTVPSWNDADFRAACRQGWTVSGTRVGPRIEAIDDREQWMADFKAVLKGTEIPRRVPNTDANAAMAMRKAVECGEVHAIKAWLHVMANNVDETDHFGLPEWRLPGDDLVSPT